MISSISIVYTVHTICRMQLHIEQFVKQKTEARLSVSFEI